MPSKLKSVVTFEVAKDVPHRELTTATEAGLAAARVALAPNGRVDALGRLRSTSANARHVRVELTMHVEGSPTLGLAAERAFAEAFGAALLARGHSNARV